MAVASSAASDEPPRKRARSAGAEDRLSELPDCLLHDILALVGSRQAVRTSVLSRRWRDLWRSAPCVDIDQREFRRACGEGEEESRWWWWWWTATASRTSLTAYCRRRSWAAPARRRWTRSALRGEVHHLREVGPPRAHAPPRVGRHPQGGTMDWPSALTLGSGDGAGTSRLKRLHLFGVHLGFISGDGGWQLAQLLPVLEDLRMESCTYGHESSTIAIPTLKSLAVVPRRTARPYALTVTSPRVASLRLFLPFSRTRAAAVRVAPEEGEQALASLVTASISVLETDQEFHLNRRMNKHKLDFLASTRSMLDRFPNVRNLDLSGFPTIALLDKASQEFPMLHNLTTLLLSECDVGVSCYVLKSVLRNAPNLEHLRLHRCKFIGTPKRKRGNSRSKGKSSSTCLDSLSSKRMNLQSVEIKCRPIDNVRQYDLVVFLKEMLCETNRRRCKRSVSEGTITILIHIT
uniref:F-box domain-containing protein n=1 Tax=Oryza punctata TaxID=4537 RepID=A0A0E0KRK8_ORYPU